MVFENKKNVFEKLKFFGFVNLILVLSSLSFTFANVNDVDRLNVIVESVKPQTIEPGNDFQVLVRIFNDGNSVANDVNLELDFNEDYFILKDDLNKIDSSINVCSGCNVYETFYFKAKNDIVSGEYPIEANAFKKSSKYSDLTLVEIVGKPDILLKSNLINEKVSAGDLVKLELDILNIGSGPINDLKISSANSNFVASGSENVYIENIDANENKKIVLELLSSEDIESGPMNLGLSFEFSDDLSNEYSQEKLVGLNFLEDVTLNLVSAKVTPATPTVGEDFDFNVRLENLGEGDAKNVQIKILSDGYVGERLIYMGTIEEDEDVPAIMTLNPNVLGQQQIDFEITYTDDLGEHKVTQSYVFNINEKGGSKVMYLGFVLVLGVGYFLFRKKKNNHE